MFEGMRVKFGRKRPVALGPHFRFNNYLSLSRLPTPPPSADYSRPAADTLSDVMGNDTLGDCVIAAGYHMLGVETANAGRPFHASLAQVIGDYSTIAGYVPGDSSTDNGTDEIAALNYWASHGFANGDKLIGWAALDSTNEAEVQAAAWLFENVFLCLELPNTFVTPFPSGNGFLWGDGAT